MFQKLAQLKTLPGDVTLPEIEEIYGHDPMWHKVKKDPRWLEYLALCITDKRNGTNDAARYPGRTDPQETESLFATPRRAR